MIRFLIAIAALSSLSEQAVIIHRESQPERINIEWTNTEKLAISIPIINGKDKERTKNRTTTVIPTANPTTDGFVTDDVTDSTDPTITTEEPVVEASTEPAEEGNGGVTESTDRPTERVTTDELESTDKTTEGVTTDEPESTEEYTSPGDSTETPPVVEGSTEKSTSDSSEQTSTLPITSEETSEPERETTPTEEKPETTEVPDTFPIIEATTESETDEITEPEVEETTEGPTEETTIESTTTTTEATTTTTQEPDFSELLGQYCLKTAEEHTKFVRLTVIPRISAIAERQNHSLDSAGCSVEKAWKIEKWQNGVALKLGDSYLAAFDTETFFHEHPQRWKPRKNADGSWSFQSVYNSWLKWQQEDSEVLITTTVTTEQERFNIEPYIGFDKLLGNHCLRVNGKTEGYRYVRMWEDGNVDLAKYCIRNEYWTIRKTAEGKELQVVLGGYAANYYMTALEDGSVKAQSSPQAWTPHNNEDGSWSFESPLGTWLSRENADEDYSMLSAAPHNGQKERFVIE